MSKDQLITLTYEWMNEIKCCKEHRTPEQFVEDLIREDMADQYIESETKHMDELSTDCFLPHE